MRVDVSYMVFDLISIRSRLMRRTNWCLLFSRKIKRRRNWRRKGLKLSDLSKSSSYFDTHIVIFLLISFNSIITHTHTISLSKSKADPKTNPLYLPPHERKHKEKYKPIPKSEPNPLWPALHFEQYDLSFLLLLVLSKHSHSSLSLSALSFYELSISEKREEDRYTILKCKWNIDEI